VLWDWRTCLCLFMVSNRPCSASIDVVFQGRAAFCAPSKVYDRPTGQELQSASASRGCAKRALMHVVVAVYMRAWQERS
jgi:hypothetical protein